jgi:hypothetical protein
MGKKPFTTRLDERVLAVAQRLADQERRSVTSLIEVAILEYADRHREHGHMASDRGDKRETP